MRNTKICLIYNFAQHYRTSIFVLMDKELPIEFVFGNKYLDVKKIDYSLLKNFKKEVENKIIFHKPIYYQTGVLGLLRENYSTYLILGEIFCVSTWLMLFLSKLYKKRIFFWSHGYYGRESKIRIIFNKLFYSAADGIFLYGNYAKELMIKEGIKHEKLHVIYNSLNYDKQISIRKNLRPSGIFKKKFNNNYLNLIFIGRLTEIKRLDLLIYALKKLKSESNYFNTTLIGDGEKRKALKQLAKEHDLEESIWFYGPCYDEIELSELIYNADLCVSPGNVGLTAIHTMTYGTPVITHNDFSYQMPEFEAILDGVTGTFFNNGDYISLANSVIRWFDDYKDRELIRKNCYKVIDTKYNPHLQIEVFKKYLL